MDEHPIVGVEAQVVGANAAVLDQVGELGRCHARRIAAAPWRRLTSPGEYGIDTGADGRGTARGNDR
jgi:hypothetical protein